MRVETCVMAASLAVAVGALASAPLLTAATMPATVGACTETTIAEIGTRLEGMPDSGSAVRFADGGGQVSYQTLRAIERSRVGDRVRVCLVSLPSTVRRATSAARSTARPTSGPSSIGLCRTRSTLAAVLRVACWDFYRTVPS